MKIRIHPDFANYGQFIKSIPEGKYTPVEVYCNLRNTVTKVEVDGRTFVIKKYKVPTLFNRFVYTWIRKSKARRSFEYADRLLSYGIETAPPVAYIEDRKYGLFNIGYFVSEYLPYPVLPESKGLDAKERELLKQQFIEFTARLHETKIIHKDYNQHNVFYYKMDGTYRFVLVDINRMDFGKDNLTLWMQAVNQLRMGVGESVEFVEKYAEIRNLDLLKCLIVLFRNRRYRRRREKMKVVFKKIFNIQAKSN
jgi:tRNA A-37 threonylcarbamoyl transferase component Bud32